MKTSIILIFLTYLIACDSKPSENNMTPKQTNKEMVAKNILGNPNYPAISYGGYRKRSREIQPTIPQLKDDMKILSAMGIKIIRTYNTKLDHASNVLEAIRQLKKIDPNFEMYVMLGAWIDCENAWTDRPVNHDEEDVEGNTAEINRTVALANKYKDIVKIIAVGNEAMVKWAASYFVQPWVILKWVNHLQELKKNNKLPKDLWITSSDNFASWGGGDSEYHTDELTALIKAVDYISVHTYPMHDTHYNPAFWGVRDNENGLSKFKKIDAAMLRAKNYAISQYESVANYVAGLGIEKPIHIGETGWASSSNGHYGSEGSKATDEYKESLYYKHMRDWTKKEDISCFYFEAFDEIWKDAENPGGSENHFGLFTIDGKAKYALWDKVDQGIFKGITRNGNAITKTYDGNETALRDQVLAPVNAKKIPAY